MRGRSFTERVRAAAAATAMLGLLVVGLASFADRAPRLISAVEHRLHSPWEFGEPALHVLGWMAITLLVTLALPRAQLRRYAAAGIILLGLVIEILQPMFSASRSFQLVDIAANLLGVAVGSAVGMRFGAALDQRETSGSDVRPTAESAPGTPAGEPSHRTGQRGTGLR